jgi:ABC-type cobalamin/Fe3+-siderophores transport system ATPase subunit
VDMLSRAHERAIVLVTHDLDTVARVATQSVLLSGGRIVGKIPGGTGARALTDMIGLVGRS